MPRSGKQPSKHSHSKTLPAPASSFTNPMSSVANIAPTTPSFGEMVKQGAALGAGQAIAHRVIGSMMGSSVVVPSEKKETLPCEKEWMSFVTCMKTTSSDIHCGSEQAAYTQCLLLQNKSN